jgi:hypothetical protein
MLKPDLFSVMRKFVSSIEEPRVFVHCGVVIFYSVEKDHLLVKGSVFDWNWDSSFKKAVLKLEETFEDSGWAEKL